MRLCKPLFLFLFPHFPKEISLVPFEEYRRYKARVIYVSSFRNLEKIVSRYSGIFHISLRVYDIIRGKIYLNKVVLEIDGDDIHDTLIDAVKIAKFLSKNNIKYIPVYTGGNGFHIYIPFLQTLEIDENDRESYEFGKEVIAKIVRYIIEKTGVESIDTQVSASLLHYIRLPGSIGKRKKYSIFLPQNLWDYSAEKILSMADTPVCLSPGAYFGSLIDVYEYLARIDLEPMENIERRIKNAGINIATRPGRETVRRLLEGIVRPCILEAVLVDNPSHHARTYFVSELYWKMFTPEEIERLIAMLEWEDYDPKKTHYHVKKITDKELLPPSCRTLRQQGICFGDRCPFYPFYHIYDLLEILHDFKTERNGEEK